MNGVEHLQRPLRAVSAIAVIAMLAMAVGMSGRPAPVAAQDGTPEPEATARSLMQAGAFDMALAEATVAGGDPHLLLYPLSTSEAATKGARAQNFSFYRNQRLDDVLIRASQLAFRSERQRLYQRGQAMLAEELPWLPIYVRLQWAVVRADVKGLRLHPTGIHRLDTVGFEIPPALEPAPGATR